MNNNVSKKSATSYCRFPTKVSKTSNNKRNFCLGCALLNFASLGAAGRTKEHRHNWSYFPACVYSSVLEQLIDNRWDDNRFRRFCPNKKCHCFTLLDDVIIVLLDNGIKAYSFSFNTGVHQYFVFFKNSSLTFLANNVYNGF